MTGEVFGMSCMGLHVLGTEEIWETRATYRYVFKTYQYACLRRIDTPSVHRYVSAALENEEDLDIVSMGREDGIDTVVRIDTPIDTFGPYGSKFLASLGKEINTQTYRYGVETVSIRMTVTFENVSIRWEERIDT